MGSNPCHELFDLINPYKFYFINGIKNILEFFFNLSAVSLHLICPPLICL
jgi:hypothetical protein